MPPLGGYEEGLSGVEIMKLALEDTQEVGEVALSAFTETEFAGYSCFLYDENIHFLLVLKEKVVEVQHLLRDIFAL